MGSEELTAAIRAGSVSLMQDDVMGRLHFCRRPTLERLTFLVRRTVRSQGY